MYQSALKGFHAMQSMTPATIFTSNGLVPSHSLPGQNAINRSLVCSGNENG